MLSEGSQAQKDKHCVMACRLGPWSCHTPGDRKEDGGSRGWGGGVGLTGTEGQFCGIRMSWRWKVGWWHSHMDVLVTELHWKWFMSWIAYHNLKNNLKLCL